MAGKSLLQQLGWNRGKYKVKEAENLFSVKSAVMEGGYRKAADSDNGPPSKKRKTEEEEMGGEMEGMWDDSIELTEDDLDNIELQASQAMTQTKHETRTGPSTSTQRVLQPLQQQPVAEPGRFLKPQLSKSSSSSASSKNHSLQSNNSISSQSKTSSRSSYPESLSGYSKSSSSSSVRTGSSSEHAQGGHLSSSRSRLGSEDISTGSQATISELTTMKQEYASIKLQLENMRQEVYAKDGENRVLRDNLTKKETELDTLKMEKISQIHQHNVHQSEREKNLQTEVARLQTQLQFKSQEERESTNRCKELQIQLKNLQAAGPSPSQGFLSTQSVSPKPTRVLVEERSPRGQSNFPSRKTFMAEEVSPVKGPQPTPSGDSHRTIPSCTDKPSVKLLEKRMKHRLKLGVNTSTCSGSQLVSRLFDLAPCKQGTVSDKGIVGLLSLQSTNTGSYKIPFERDKSTSLLSPVRGRRLSDLHGLLTRSDKPSIVNLVPIEHFNMAVQGLSSLTKTENLTSDSSSITSTSTESVTPDPSTLQDAVLVLPVINDYLKHYIDMLDAALDSSEGSTTTTTISSSSSGSFDTSSESPTGSFGLFVKSSASWANDLEHLAIASVETLYELLSSTAVKDVLLYKDPNQSPRTPSSSGHFENSDSDIQWKDSPTKLSYVKNYVSKLQILKKVLKLTSPGNKTRSCNARMVINCLDILNVLAVYSNEKQITCLLPVLSEESLQNCLDHDTDTDIVIHALHLFKTLLKSNHVVSSLCSNATGCVLLTVYNLCTKKFTNSSLDTRLTISSVIIDSILYLASSHRGCFTLVLESDCLCSAEVVKRIVSLLHSVMRAYKTCTANKQGTSSNTAETLKCDTSPSRHEETSLQILKNGLQLLHLMSQLDSEFINRHIPVQYKYVQLVCGMTHIFKHMENEYNAVHDLWDFNQYDSELSQDSDSDEPMDQQ